MPKTLFTIGYEGREIGRFVEELRNAGVGAVADVRAVAVSRKPGFSKRVLAERLNEAGIGYRHFVELGDPKEGRDAARSGKYDVFERVYAQHLATSQAQSVLADLRRYADDQATCLLCFERDPVFCHRSRIASALIGSGFVVQNLIVSEPSRHGNRVEGRTRRHVGQGASPT